MSPPLLLIRADAGQGIGAGHALRCSSLVEEWVRRGGAARFFGEVPPAIAARLVRAGAEVRPTVELEHTSPGGWCVVDGYCFGGDLQKQLRGRGHRVLCIDDYGEIGSYDADVILDQNVAASQSDYPPSTRAFIGSRFVLLRSEFRGRRASGASGRVLVTLGGGDLANLSPRVVQAAQRAGAVVRVLVGPTQAAHVALPGAEVVVDPPSVAEHMEWCTLAVTASGTSAWELAALGVPSLQFFVAENQRRNTLRLAELGVCRSLGGPTDASDAQLESAIHSLLDDAGARAQMAERGQTLIDGFGASRVCDVLES